jgi:hypothetical protein
MKIGYAMVLCLMIAVSFPMGANAQSTKVKDSNMLTYENISYGITMKYPADWIIKQRANALVVFGAPDKDPFDNAFYVFIEDFDHNPKTLSEFTDSEIENFKKNLDDFHLQYRNKTSIAGQPASEIILTWKLPLQKSSQTFDIVTHAIYIISKDRAYILSFSVEKSRYQEYLGDVRKMFQSFKISSQEKVESQWPEVAFNPHTAA